MNAAIGQLWSNLLFLLIVAIFMELAISAILSIKMIDNFLNTSKRKSIKNVLVLIVAFGVCAKVNELRFLHGTRIHLPEVIHYILSSLVLARLSNLVHDLFSFLIARSRAQM